MSEWISVDERLPDYGVPVLTVRMSNYGDSAKPRVAFERRTHTDKYGEHWEMAKWPGVVTHCPYGKLLRWMPLPEASDE